MKMNGSCPRATACGRVVLTSTIAGIINGNSHAKTYLYSEKDCTNLDKPVPPYPKSKTFAERASWDYRASLGDDSALELVEINPGKGYGRIFEARLRRSG